MNSKILSSFICDPQQISSLTKQWIHKASYQNRDVYINPLDKEEWEKIRFWSEMKEEEYTLLENTYNISMDDLILLAVSEKTEEIIICACNELLRRENEMGKEFRERLIKKLEELTAVTNDKAELQRAKLIIYETELFDATNKKTILNKDFQQVNREASFYKDISERAKKILNQLI